MLLVEPLRHVANPDFGAVIFRRTFPEIANEGGLWDASSKIYPYLYGRSNKANFFWKFPSGAKVSFRHLVHEDSVHQWQGSEIPLICIDEGTHFTQYQFWYLLSRNRTTCGVKPYMRVTCNPDADSFLAKMLEWWIDQDTGYAIPEKSGKLRWFIRDGDEALLWADSPDDPALNQDPDIRPRSFTFVPTKLTDNQILTSLNPEYLSTLKSLPLVERERLLYGNWKIRPSAGNVFRTEWFETVDSTPPLDDMILCRSWDLASTESTGSNDPDWTVGTLMGKRKTQINLDGASVTDPNYYVLEVLRLRGTPLAVENLVKKTADSDGKKVKIRIEQEMGSSGAIVIDHYRRNVLKGYDIKGEKVSGDKVTRAKGMSAAAEQGRIKILRAPWNQGWLNELHGFPEAKHDDAVDSATLAFKTLDGPWRRLNAW